MNYFQNYLATVEDDADSHGSTCNADGAVYQTRQELITASEFLVACSA